MLVLDAVGAAATRLRRANSLRPHTPTLYGWDAESPRALPRSSFTSSSAASSAASLPQSLTADVAPLHAGADAPPDDVEALRGQLEHLQVRLAESEVAASALAAELGSRDDEYAQHLASVHSTHAEALNAMEHSLRAEVRPRCHAKGQRLGQHARSTRAPLHPLRLPATRRVRKRPTRAAAPHWRACGGARRAAAPCTRILEVGGP